MVSKDTAIARARSGAPLNVAEFAAILELGVSAFYKNKKRGLYDAFHTDPILGPRCYSGVLIAKWLDGETLRERSFGRRVPTRPSRQLQSAS